MLRFFLGSVIFLTGISALPAQTPVFPLGDVREGMRGTGKTVFQGDKIEDFQVEILGVLPNAGPHESLILAKLSGGPLEHTGVMQGMSGSPVYIDGKLLGAVAMAFPFSKDPICAIRPIQDMLRLASEADPQKSTGNLRAAIESSDLSRLLPAPSHGGQLVNISTPLGLGGFTQRTRDVFAPILEKLGMQPMQGLSSGGTSENADNAAFGDPAKIQPGSMISVELMTGDLAVGADGTVTSVDTNGLLAFGHRFLAVGPTGLPFRASRVLALLPSVNTSFKISSPGELMGVIRQDRDTGISGRFGQRASLVPVEIHVRRAGRADFTYRLSVIRDSMLTPLLLQMAVFSTVDSTERSAGASTISIRGKMLLAGGQTVRLDSVYAADSATAQGASAAAATPIAYLMQSGFDSLDITRADYDIDVVEKKQTLDITDLVASRREVRPGDTVRLTVTLTADDGTDTQKTVDYEVPVGGPAGTLNFTVADGPLTSFQELRTALATQPRTADQALSVLARLRDNNKAFVRVWRAETAYTAGVEELPSPPPSVAMVMAASGAGTGILKNSKVGEMVINAGDQMVTGSRTIQVEVRP